MKVKLKLMVLSKAIVYKSATQVKLNECILPGTFITPCYQFFLNTAPPLGDGQKKESRLPGTLITLEVILLFSAAAFLGCCFFSCFFSGCFFCCCHVFEF